MNKILQQVSESINVKLANTIREKESTGVIITKMQTGDPDFPTADFICEAAQKAMNKGDTHYCASAGQANLRLALKKKLIIRNNIKNAEVNNILITQGAVHGLYLILQTLLNPQDEVIIISPYWMPYHSNILLADGIPVVVNSLFSKGFLPDLIDIKEAITAKTKAIIINSPNNPTGSVYSKKLLKMIAVLCNEEQIYLISDEVYEDLIYQNEHYSPQALLPKSQYIISIFSFSKSYAMTGWRIGYIYAEKAIIEQANKLTQYVTTSINSFVQAGALAALEHKNAKKNQNKMLSIYTKRRQLINSLIVGTWLEKNVFFPQGTFYLFINIAIFDMDSMTFVSELIEQKKVAFTPGIAFGEQSDDFIRMTFASDEKAIKQAVTTLIGLY